MDDSEDRTQVVGDDSAGSGGVSAPARLICRDPSTLGDGVGAEIKLVSGPVTVGRSREADVQIKSDSVSRKHATIYPGAGFWGIKDLDSTNGVKINGESVKQGWMRDGDSVIIGKVAYAFSQEQVREPDAEQSGFTETITADRTMFVGQDASAASALLKSTAAAAREPEPPPQPMTEPTRSDTAQTDPTGGQRASASAAPAPKRQLPLKQIGIGAGAVLVVAILAMFFLGGGDAEMREAVERTDHQIKRFISREARRGVVSGSALEAQLEQLAEMRDGLEPLVASHPNAVDLHELHATVAFLEFSRRFATAMSENDLGQADSHVSELRGIVDETELVALNVTEGGEIHQRYREITKLLDLAEAAVHLKNFVIAYPNPSKSDNQPIREVLDEVVDARGRFAKLRKQHNLSLTVTYPYLGAGIGEIADGDLSLIDRWQRVLK